MTPEQPDLRPPGSLPEAADPAGSGRVAVWLGLVLLLGLAVAVVVFLPTYTATDRRDPPPASEPAREVLPVEPAAPADAGARLSAEQALRAYLRLRARLELENAPVWGDSEWDEAAAEVKRGDRLFLQNDFISAHAAYRQGIERLEALDASRGQRLDAALRDGAQALAEGRVETAVTRFEYALAIDPQNVQATEGLARAEVRAQLLALMAAGGRAEEQGELDAALGAYREAAALDDAYAPAAEAVRRVTAEIERTAFKASMDQALAALDAGRLTAADAALSAAAALRPNDDSVRDLRRRLDTVRKQRTLAELRRSASARVAAEDWQAALKAYEQALKVDPKAAFAVVGAKDARASLRLHRQVDHYLAQPGRLAGAEPLANAEQVLQAAGKAPEGQPRLAGKLAQLHRLVEQARTPVTVELRSDGQTEVVIYHVGRRGRFLQQQVELRPGSYVAVGSRAGYRDVRQEFEVTADGPPLVVTIRCEETI
jgi:tetratricopeptide (TPR) repeat protein